MNIAVVILATVIALLIALCVYKIVPLHQSNNRYTAIDGLRGYLAFFVFLHHSSIWFFYLHDGNWRLPPSNLFSHLGQSSVALFFMITGFLFYSKILKSKGKKIDWTYIYTSRLLRLVPLYLFSLLTLFIIVWFVSENSAIEPLKQSITNTLKWVLFTIPGAPDLRNVQHTTLIMAGVTWSLPYEWLFYVSLPAIALLTARSVRLVTSIISIVAGACILTVFDPASIHIKTFMGGMICAAIHYKGFGLKVGKSKAYSMLIMVLLAVLVHQFPTSHGNIQIAILTVIFFGISCGNNVFGLLSLKVSRILGEMAYSIYLLHGLILYIFFNFIITKESALNLTPNQYWLAILLTTPALIILSAITFSTIEKPSMNRAPQASEMLKAALRLNK